MIDLINKISPDKNFNFSKIGSVFAFNENYIAFVIDLLEIELFEYKRKDKKVKKKFHFDRILIIYFN
jgi:hypothetical protein